MSFPVEKEVLQVVGSAEGIGWVYPSIQGHFIWTMYDSAGFLVIPTPVMIRPGSIEFHGLPPGEMLTVVIIG